MRTEGQPILSPTCEGGVRGGGPRALERRRRPFLLSKRGQNPLRIKKKVAKIEVFMENASNMQSRRDPRHLDNRRAV